MEKISLMSLGGVQENRKNMYYMEYKGEGIILDAGSASYAQKGIGIDTVIPDINYFKNKNVVAILISHGHIDQMGAIDKLLNVLGDVKVYGSDYTIEFLKLHTKKQKNLHKIDYDRELKIGNFTIESVRLSHAIFGTLGFVINTPSGAVTYMTDYNFNQTVQKSDRTHVAKIVKLKEKYDIVALMTETVSIDQEGVAAHEQNAINKFDDIISKNEDRTFISLYSSDVSGMSNILNISEILDKKICIIGRDMLNYVNIARKLGYIKHSQNRFIKISDLKKYHPSDLLIVVSGTYEEPFRELEKMAKGLGILTLTENDTIVIASPPYDQIESYAQKVYDSIARTHARIINQKANVPSNAYKEDIKMMVNLFEPNFIFPIKGEFRKQAELEVESFKLGYEPGQVVIMGIGDVIEFDKIEALRVKTESLKNIAIKKDTNKPINEVVIRDREVLSQNGYVTIILTRDSKTKKMTVKPKIVSGGIIDFNHNEKIIEDIENIITKIVGEEEFEFKDVQFSIRNKVTRHLDKIMNKKPMILNISIDI